MNLFFSENAINNPLPNQIPQTPQLKALNELNELGRNLMEKSLNDPATPLNVAVTDLSNGIQQQLLQQQQKLSLNEIQQLKLNNLTNTINSNTNNQQRALIETTNQNGGDIFNILNGLMIKLEDIKPGNIPPLSLYDKNNLKIILHFARDSPHPNINVVVISATSTNSVSSLKNFSFQAAVPKVIKANLKKNNLFNLSFFY